MDVFPTGLVFRECVDGEHGELVRPEEEAIVARSVPKRQREFRAGRAAARLALRELSVPDAPILRNDDRSPRWPAGIVGSISHKAGRAVAVVGRRADYRGVGVDIEPAVAIEERLWRRVLTPEEIAALPRTDTGVRALLLFSAKEAFHKCVHPAFGVFFDYREASFTVDPEAGTFRVAIRREVPDAFPPEDRFLGRFRIRDGRILTGVTLPAV